MASWLEEYQSIKAEMEQDFSLSLPNIEQLITYQEIVYRVGVLETAKALCNAAPISVDTKALARHYQLVDAHLRCLEAERRFGLPADEKLRLSRKTAAEALGKTLADCQRRFSSFRPANENTYRESISKHINTVLPVWMQLRNTYVKVEKRKAAKK